jgi:hypothetical protein
VSTGQNRRPRPSFGASSTDQSGPPRSRPPTTIAATCGPPTSCSPADHPSTAIRTAAGGPSRTTSRDRPESGRTQPFRLRFCSEHEFDGEGCTASRILRDLGHVSPGQRSPVELARRRVGRSRLWGTGPSVPWGPRRRDRLLVAGVAGCPHRGRCTRWMVPGTLRRCHGPQWLGHPDHRVLRQLGVRRDPTRRNAPRRLSSTGHAPPTDPGGPLEARDGWPPAGAPSRRRTRSIFTTRFLQPSIWYPAKSSALRDP